MAYSPAKLALLAGTEWDLDHPRLWSYISDDAMTTARVDEYITDALMRRMRVGDLVIVTQTTAGAVTASTLTVCMAVTADGADLADGTAITVTNSD